MLVPEFICRDLLAPIHAVGAEPVFYVVDRQLQPITLPYVLGVRAVLAVNYFGFPQDLKPFRVYCDRNDAALIEDNAHGFLSQDERGAVLGTRGDLGLFSMRKTFTLPDGAALRVIKTEWQSRLEQQLPCRNESLPLIYRVKHGLGRVQRQTGLQILTSGQDLARGIRRWRTGFDVAPPSAESEYEMPPTVAPHCRTLAALSRLDTLGEIARRRELYREFHEALASLEIRPVFAELPVGTAPYGYPFYADKTVAKLVVKIAHKRGLDCINWPDLPSAVVPDAPSHYRSLWLVNFLC